MQPSFSLPVVLIGIISLAGLGLGISNTISQQKIQQEILTQVSQLQEMSSNTATVVAPSEIIQSNNQQPQQVVLTTTQAQQLVMTAWNIDFTPIEGFPPQLGLVANTNGTYAVTVTVPPLDDSVASTKFEGTASFVNNAWTLSNPPVKTWSCHPGRGHQNYSTVNCL
jgi:hypothetical protein